MVINTTKNTLREAPAMAPHGIWKVVSQLFVIAKYISQVTPQDTGSPVSSAREPYSRHS